MTSDTDDALSWDGDEDDAVPTTSPVTRAPAASEPRRPLPEGWNAVGKGSESLPAPASSIEADVAQDADPDDAPAVLSTAMLLAVGIVGGIYLLYSVGWVVGGLRLKPLASFFVSDAMFLPWFILSVAAPALWFLAGWVLTRGKASWVRIGVLLLGVVLLVPWPFVTVGVIGS